MKEGWRAEEKKQAADDAAAAKADFEYAESNYKRLKGIPDATPNELDNAQSRLTFTKRKYESAQTKSDMLHSGNRQEDKDESKAEFERAEAHAKLLRRGTRDEDKEIARAQM